MRYGPYAQALELSGMRDEIRLFCRIYTPGPFG
jgi:hypothetical protein